jgi:hypothetical protein
MKVVPPKVQAPIIPDKPKEDPPKIESKPKIEN